MTQTFKNGPSLYRLLESAPLTILSDFLAKADKGKFASYFTVVPWQDKPEEGGTTAFRKHLTGCASSTPPSRPPIPANLASPCPAVDSFTLASWDDLMKSYLKLVIQYSECAQKLDTIVNGW